jgi:hypothetical protein
MELYIDTSRFEFQACGPMKPRLDKDGVQRVDRDTKFPQWAVDVVAWNAEDEAGRTETILITVASSETPPPLTQMQFVTVQGLRAVPWVSDNGNRQVRVAYRADSVMPMAEAVKKAS